MKYDLNRLKDAADGWIPSISPDEGILERALQSGRKKKEWHAARAMTALAACAVVLLALGVIFMPGMRNHPDDTGDGDHLLAQGGEAQTDISSADDASAGEDLEAYQAYYPFFSRDMTGNGAEFGNVIIRRLDDYDGLFVFEEKESGERVIPGHYWQALAYFPLTETGLIQLGANEGLRLVDRTGRVMEGAYSYFEYVGGGVAIVANSDADETEPDNMYLVSTADGTSLSREYTIIGKMYSGDVRLLMGHDDQELLGDFDVLDMDGRVIARVSELSGVYFGEWLGVKLPGEEDCCLIDFEGAVQLGGMRFSRISYEKEDMLIVWTDEGSGVIGRDGEWIFEPGRYLMIEFAGDGLFRAMDAKSGEWVQINAAGEEVDTLSFRLDQMKDRLGERYSDWRNGMGEMGFIIVSLLVGWLLLRLGWSKQNGELLHMIMTELGFAAYIAGLLFIGHRNSTDYVTIFPTDTSVLDAGQIAGWWILSALAMTASLIAACPKLRAQKKAFLVGYGLMLLPWAWKAVCGDVSVSGWRTFSMVIFSGGPLLAILLYWVRPVKRFMAWCARFDMLNEYGKKTRIAWLVLIALALVNFGAGCFISGQELVKFTHQTECRKGLTEELDEAWLDEVNELNAEYRASGYDEGVLDRKEHDYPVLAAVRWLHENELDELTAQMIYTVRMTGGVQLRRAADVQLILEKAEGASEKVWQIEMKSPTAEEDGSVCAETVLLAAPGEPLPDIEAWLSIRQRGDADSMFAAQRFYRAELGMVVRDAYAVD